MIVSYCCSKGLLSVKTQFFALIFLNGPSDVYSVRLFKLGVFMFKYYFSLSSMLLGAGSCGSVNFHGRASVIV
jgi:hypothetical protein